MATIDSTRGMFGDLDPQRDPREQILEPHLAAALQPALGAAGEVLGVLSLLPQAFAQAQRNELARLERSDREPKQSPRIDAIRLSISRAETLRATAAHGEARFARLVATMDETAQILHGFVSGPDLDPLPNYRVELDAGVPDDPKGSKPQSATTAADGYFRIVLRERVIEQRIPVERVSAAIGRLLAGKVDAKNAAFKAAAAADAAANGRLGRIVVKSPQGEIVHEDPTPVELDTGDVYREYVVDATSKNTVPPVNPRGSVDPKAAADAKAGADAKARAATEAKAMSDAKATRPAPAPRAPTTTAKLTKPDKPRRGK